MRDVRGGDAFRGRPGRRRPRGKRATEIDAEDSAAEIENDRVELAPVQPAT